MSRLVETKQTRDESAWGFRRDARPESIRLALEHIELVAQQFDVVLHHAGDLPRGLEGRTGRRAHRIDPVLQVPQLVAAIGRGGGEGIDRPAPRIEVRRGIVRSKLKANKHLSIGYRLHFEPYNLEMVRCGTQKIYGEIKKLSGGFGFRAGPSQWRLTQKFAGGGPLMDVGIYVIQAMCYVTGMEPIAVTAQEGVKTDLERFKEVEQSLSWQMEFPNGLITDCRTSYAEGMNFLKAEAENGTFELTSAYNYPGKEELLQPG